VGPRASLAVFRFTGDLAHRQGFCLHLQVRFRVNVRGVKGDVTKPSANRVDIYARAEQVAGGGGANRSTILWIPKRVMG